MSELLVAANESKLLKQQRRDAAIADDLRHLEQHDLMGQSSPERLRDLMEKAKAQIVAEVMLLLVFTRRDISCVIPLQVSDEFRLREQVDSAFLKATSPAAPVLDIPQSTAMMAALVVKSTVHNSLPLPDLSSRSESPPAASSVSPEPNTDSTSIAGLKARLAALQVCRNVIFGDTSHLSSILRLLVSPHLQKPHPLFSTRYRLW